MWLTIGHREKATDGTPQVGMCTEAEAGSLGRLESIRSKQTLLILKYKIKAEKFICHAPSAEGCKILFCGDYDGKGMGTDFWRDQLGWEGEKPPRSIYNRYEAVGNPERKEDNSRIRFSWDLETGKWMDKSTWLKMKRHSGSCQVTVDVKAKGNDEVTNCHTMTDVEKRERNGTQVQLTKKDIIVFDLEEGTVDQSSNEEQRGENGDAPVASSDIQRQRKGVDLGAKSVPKQERIVAPTRSPTRRKSSPEASTMLPSELVSRIDPTLNPEAMADTIPENRTKESQEPIFAEGLAPGANISLESTPKVTESRLDGGSGTSIGAIHDIIDTEQNERESEKTLSSRAARQDHPIALTLETDIDPERWVKVPRLLEEKGENLNDPAETALAATGGQKRSGNGRQPRLKTFLEIRWQFLEC
ncbi:conserved hypothetical protein [Histoplasma capsulatum H143]|uniref:Uncharacterized protein n=1 Tax=Ajellomyces capsulatus (strain H143) TaxID=544712 RepID=C6HB19_AJECH|nr:conserved hypothetical protein [Histoplasma capsulatum H143]